MKKGLVSVIIPITRNDMFIEKCVASVRNSIYKNIEIIIVDEGLERSAQRNIGFARSTGEFILILDSDMTIHMSLIGQCILYNRLRHIEGFYIPEIIVGAGFWIKVRNFERSFYNGTRIDAIRFIKREFWISFDENLTGAEDWDWDRRFQGLKGISGYPLYHHEHYHGKFSFRYYFKKKKYYSKWFGIYKKRYGNCPELNFWYRYFGVFFENKKWKRIIKQPYLFLCVLFLRIFVGVAYLCAKKK